MQINSDSVISDHWIILGFFVHHLTEHEFNYVVSILCWSFVLITRSATFCPCLIVFTYRSANTKCGKEMINFKKTSVHSSDKSTVLAVCHFVKGLSKFTHTKKWTLTAQQWTFLKIQCVYSWAHLRPGQSRHTEALHRHNKLLPCSQRRGEVTTPTTSSDTSVPMSLKWYFSCTGNRSAMNSWLFPPPLTHKQLEWLLFYPFEDGVCCFAVIVKNKTKKLWTSLILFSLKS